MRGCYLWLMLLPYICGRCYNNGGWCYCLLYLYSYLLADVVTNIVADVITTCFSIMCWLMLLPSGRWNSHCRVVNVEWLMLLPLGRCYNPGSMILLQFKFWDVKQNLIPYMWQMVFANISIQGWIVDPDVKSLFYMVGWSMMKNI